MALQKHMYLKYMNTGDNLAEIICIATLYYAHLYYALV